MKVVIVVLTPVASPPPVPEQYLWVLMERFYEQAVLPAIPVSALEPRGFHFSRLLRYKSSSGIFVQKALQNNS